MKIINFYHSQKSAEYSPNYLKSFTIETDEIVINGNISKNVDGSLNIHFFEPKIDTFGFKRFVLSNFDSLKK